MTFKPLTASRKRLGLLEMNSEDLSKNDSQCAEKEQCSSNERVPTSMSLNRPETVVLPELPDRFGSEFDDVIPSPDMEKKPVFRDEDSDQSTYSLNCPRVNSPEKIIICLDLSSEMEKMIFRSRAGDKQNPLKLVRAALELFLHTKTKMDFRHEYALVLMQESLIWICDFTNNPNEILDLLDDLPNTTSCETFNIASLFEIIREKVALPVVVGDQSVLPPPFTVRVLLIYGRSHCLVEMGDREAQKYLESSPYFFVDAFYIHEPPSGDNKCEMIFNALCDLDHKGLSYILEAAQNPTKVFNCIAQLLSHPLLRPVQKMVSYRLACPPGTDSAE